MIRTIDDLSESEVARYYTFLTHAGRSLALWRSKRPADVIANANDTILAGQVKAVEEATAAPDKD